MVGILILVSCQDEITPQVNVDKEGITAQTPLANLISDVTTLDGSADNIIDKSSCSTVIFPISGLIEDNEIVFNFLSEVLALGAEALEIEWVFPLEITLNDYTKVTLHTADDLKVLQETCLEGGADPDIECIDFVYPFKGFVFNTRTENVESIKISSDKEFYQTIISPDLIITIEYPIYLEISDGTRQVANNNEELSLIISANADICDEHDTVEFDDIIEKELGERLFSHAWSITFFEEGGADKSTLFTDYSILFATDFTLRSEGPEVSLGEWEVDSYENIKLLSIEFDTEMEPLILLNHEWAIISISDTQITMETQEDEEELPIRLQLSSL